MTYLDGEKDENAVFFPILDGLTDLLCQIPNHPYFDIKASKLSVGILGAIRQFEKTGDIQAFNMEIERLKAFLDTANAIGHYRKEKYGKKKKSN